MKRRLEITSHFDCAREGSRYRSATAPNNRAVKHDRPGHHTCQEMFDASYGDELSDLLHQRRKDADFIIWVK